MPRLSDAEILSAARSVLSFLGLSNANKLDVLAILRGRRIWTLKGLRTLVYQTCPDDQLGDKDAKTEYHGDQIVITTKFSVHQKLEQGEGRARFTLAHELGHAVLHNAVTRFRATGTSGSSRRKWERPYEDPERHANIFAAALLIDNAVAETLPNTKAISDKFGVSLVAAEVCFSDLERGRNRAASAERVARKAAAFQAQRTYDPILSMKFLPECCHNCGEQALLPEGVNVRCFNCRALRDFQDGDAA
jgi:hypothetical protein